MWSLSSILHAKFLYKSDILTTEVKDRTKQGRNAYKDRESNNDITSNPASREFVVYNGTFVSEAIQQTA